MFRLTFYFSLVMCICVLVADVDGGWWRRRTVHHHHHHHTICNCNRALKLMKDIKEQKKELAKRDVAAILSLDEDYPGLDEFVDHLNSKRGVLDVDELDDIIKRATRKSASQTSCHCGRSLVDNYIPTE